MRRRLAARLGIGLITFVIGVAIASIGFRREPVKPVPVEQQESFPLRLGIFIEVDGVTFSNDNSKFNLFDDYRERETAAMVSPKELSEVVHKLVAAGLLEEKELNAPSFISLPVSNTIIIAWPDRVRKFTWINGDECRVPEKYLSVLEEMNARYNAPLIKDFITHNRR